MADPRCALCGAPAVGTARAGGVGTIPVCAAHGGGPPPKRAHKYSAQATVVDGVKFASKKEAKRYTELKQLEAAGAISGLRLQTRFPLRVNDVLICTYVADFVYVEAGLPVVEDCKGVRTPVYKIKAKLMQAVHGITIRET